jgi:hypothetical protein
MYDHLAMLCRSPHARKGGDFSLKQEFTRGIASKIGLGMYFEKETEPEHIEAVENALHRLAENFESWFEKERGGFLEATFGEVCSLVYCAENPKKIPDYPDVLIIAVDATKSAAACNEIAKEKWNELNPLAFPPVEDAWDLTSKEESPAKEEMSRETSAVAAAHEAAGEAYIAAGQAFEAAAEAYEAMAEERLLEYAETESEEVSGAAS